ncbi:MAG: PQQ-binding-like beta-propeller repeat protein [Planctomycetota bacterium]
MTVLSSLVLPLLSTPLVPTTEGEHTWPQWDGPARTGVSTETDWVSEGKEEDLWRVELGLGYSTVSVADGRLYTMGYDREAGLDSVFCLDALTGKTIWQHSYPSEIWNRAHEGGTVNTPSIDGDVVYSLNREGNLFCLDGKTGEVVWHNFLMGEDNAHELEIPVWGFSASPLVVGDELFVNCGRILSIDKETGDVLWRSEDYGHGYGTPIAFELDGAKLLAATNGKKVCVVNQKDGSEVASVEFAGKTRGINAATPVLIEENTIFVTSGTLGAGARFALEDGQLVEVWQNRKMVNSFSGCVKVGDHLYGFDKQILECIDVDGNSMWSERGIGNGAVLAAGKRLLVMGGTGELIVAKASPEAYEVLSKVKLFEEGRFWTKPILVNGVIYCRNSKGALVARDHRTTDF